MYTVYLLTESDWKVCPDFKFNNKDEMITFITICMERGYEVYIIQHRSSKGE